MSGSFRLHRDGGRLLTLTGPGGVGKTRLALQIAHDLTDTFEDGICYVQLATLHDAALVPEVVAQTLGLREQVTTPLSEQVRAFLQHKHLLLVLDNYEQVLEAASFVADLLATCTRLSVLVTSRSPLRLRIEKLYGLGRTLVRHGKVEQGAEAFAKEALHLARRIGDQNSISNAFATLGMIAQASGKLDEASIAFTESYSHARLAENIGLMSRALVHLAEVARAQGDVVRATSLLEESLANAQAIGITWDISIIKTQLGHLAHQQQNYALAKARYREALALYRAFGSPTYTALCLEGFAAAVCAEGHYVQAARLCAVAATLREQAQTPLPPAEREAFDRTVAAAKEALGELTFVQEWTTGSALTHDQAIDYALSGVCA